MTTTFGNDIDQVLKGPSIRDAEFVKLTVPGSTDAGGPNYYFSSSYKNETIVDPIDNSAGIARAWTALGAFVSISGHQRDLSVTSYDTTISLMALDPSKIGYVLSVGQNQDGSSHSGLKGSRVQIYRGFYDENYNLIGTGAKIQLRYTGIVTSYTINEERVEGIDTFTLSLHCSSYKTVLENRVSGRYTNQSSWKNHNASDVAMNRVASISNTNFPFGVKLA